MEPPPARGQPGRFVTRDRTRDRSDLGASPDWLVGLGQIVVVERHVAALPLAAVDLPVPLSVAQLECVWRLPVHWLAHHRAASRADGRRAACVTPLELDRVFERVALQYVVIKSHGYRYPTHSALARELGAIGRSWGR